MHEALADLPSSWAALCLLALLLGARHGVDADHLATIDALVRLNHRDGRRWARWCGALFSLGHGAVVLAVALLAGWAGSRWQTPAALQATGAGLSIAVLLALGLANLLALLRSRPGQVLRPVGLRSRWLGRWLGARQPLAVAGVGMLFAFSFDTVSQAALFSLAGAQHGGAGAALLLALLFTLGMLVADGLNGWWLGRLLSGTDTAAAARASRWMSAAVAAVALGVAGLGLARLLAPALDDWADAHGLWTAAGISLLLLACGLAGRQAARQRSQAQTTS